MPDYLNQIKSTLELKALNQEHQTGVPVEVAQQEENSGQPVAQGINYGYGPVTESILANWDTPGPSVQDLSSQAIQAGYGKSRYDITNPYEPGMDLEDVRAREQSDFAKIGMGITKMGTTALSTFANTTAGTVFGAFAAGAEAIRQIADGQLDAGGILNAGVNNAVSEWLIDFQRKADEWFPNYRTEEERTEKYQREWYKHLGDANFIGDVFIKNLGFTLGTMAGGAAWTRAMAPLIRSASANILKGAVLAAEGDAEATAAMNTAVEAWRTGKISTVKAEELLKNIKNSAKALNKADARMQLYGSIISAMGEGSAEGLMAKDEFKQNFKQDNDRRFYQEYQALEQELLDSNDSRYVTLAGVMNPETGAAEFHRVLTEEGKAELSRRRKELADKYNGYLEAANGKADELASTVFLLNLPILTGSNLAQFGKMFSGGWGTARKTVRGIAGGITAAAQKGADYAKPVIESTIRSTGNKVLRTLEKAGKNMLTESAEEMAQGTVSEGGKKVAMAYFNNGGYDPKAVDSTRDWFEKMYQGGAEYIGDVKNWQEGFMGALTGLFGVPSFRFRKGQWWSGGVIGAAMEAGEEIDAERNAAETLHTLVTSKDFQDRWHDHIRRLKYSDEMDESAVKNNQYAWHSAENEKLINDIMSFARAGKLDDLNDLVEVYANLTESDADKMRSVFKDDKNFQQQIQNKSDKEVVEKIREQADKMKDAIKDYKEIYDALQTRAPMGASPEFLDEMLFTAANIRQFEKRFSKMFDETMQTLEKTPQVAKLLDTEVHEQNPILDAFNTLKDVRTVLESYFGADPARAIPKRVEDLFNSSMDILDKYLGKKDSEPRKKVEDMKQLMQDRRAFYDKLQRMESPSTTKQAQEEFDKQAITPEKVEKKAEEVHAEEMTSNFKTLADIRAAYDQLKGRQQVLAFEKSLEAIEDKNPLVKQYMDLRRRQYKISHFSNDKQNSNLVPIVMSEEYADIPDMEKMDMMSMKVPFLMQRMWLHTDTADDMTADKAVFPTLDEFMKKFPSSSNAQYALALEMAKKALNTFYGIDSQNAPVEDLSQDLQGKPEKKIQPTPKPGEHSEYDAPQGQSTAKGPSAPVVSGETKADKKEGSSQPEGSTPTPEGQVAADNSPEPMAAPATEEQVFTDMSSSYEESPAERKERQEEATSPDSVREYLELSIPEVEWKQHKKAREATQTHRIDKYKQADLSDFVEFTTDEEGKVVATKNPEYAPIWKALYDKEAFKTVVDIKPGEKIYFGYDRDFPTYNGHRQILLFVERNNALVPITTLTLRDDLYDDVQHLRFAINEEFEADGFDDDGKFIFSKTSTVYNKLPGFIDYDFEGKEKPIAEISDYDDSAPILFIDKTGNPVVLRGTIAQESIPKQLRNQKDVVAASGKEGNPYLGSLYYLVKDGTFDGSGNPKYIPLRLNVQHFTENYRDIPGEIFGRIKTTLSNIASIVHFADNKNIDEQIGKMKAELKNLVKDLDIHNMEFSIGNFTEDRGIGLKITIAEKDGSTTDKVFAANAITDTVLTDFIAAQHPSIQVKPVDGVMENLDEMVREGMLFSNARKLKAKGVNIRALPYAQTIGGKNVEPGFYAVTEEQKIALGESDAQPETVDEFADTPAPSQQSSVSSDLISGFFAGDAIGTGQGLASAFGGATLEDMESFDKERSYVREATGATTAIPRTYDGLSDTQKGLLKAKGISPEVYNSYGPELQEQLLRCA